MTHLRLHEPTDSPFYAPFSWRAALAASVIGGLVFALLHVGLLHALRGVPPWAPVRMIAAMVLGPEVLSPPDTFDIMVLLAAILLHGTLSLVYGVFLAFLLPAVNTLWSIVVGGLYGLILYYINFYGLDAFSPWFIEERDTVSMISHFTFGAVVASTYKALHSRCHGGGCEPPADADT